MLSALSVCYCVNLFLSCITVPWEFICVTCKQMFTFTFTTATAAFNSPSSAFHSSVKITVTKKCMLVLFCDICGGKLFLTGGFCVTGHKEFNTDWSTESFIPNIHSQGHEDISNRYTYGDMTAYLHFLMRDHICNIRSHLSIIENTSCPHKLHFSDHRDRPSHSELNETLTTKHCDSSMFSSYKVKE